MKIKIFIAALGILTLIVSCTKQRALDDSKRFVLLPSEKTNVRFANQIESTPNLNILNYIYFYNGSGVAAADFNNDGLQDIYFGANLDHDALYINNGDLSFTDISKDAGINSFGQWTNGVTTTDINNDGWIDIYVCNVAHHENPNSHNLLWINQGLNKAGIPTFKEAAKEYQLDYSGYSTQAAFFDYDLDGDLDLFLLNHATNPNQNYGDGKRRIQNNAALGDKLFENQEGQFVDVSEEANIYQSAFGYGLGLAISDVNNDGYPDIYVGNDFYENDYLYINQGNKTFKETIYSEEKALGHSTHFSMGNCIADINNDGQPDILSVDMLPEDLKTYKTSGTEFNYQIYQNYLNNGYAPQYMQNALQINNGTGIFSETAFISGIAATEWSWAPLIADFDNDGLQDVYITNGIPGATNDMDFINFIANDNIQKSLGQNMTEKELQFIKKIPEKKTANYLFKNQANLKFSDSTKTWFQETTSFSNGGVYIDLENDGDLDLVVNNSNDEAYVFENKLDNETHNYVKIALLGTPKNTKAIGAKVYLFHNGIMQLRENFPVNGYLSTVGPQLHFGLGEVSTIDSLFVVWPNKKYQKIESVSTNQTLELDISNSAGDFYTLDFFRKEKSFQKLSNFIDFKHQENINLDFNKDPLLPYSEANEGPEISIGDINNDGLQDVFIGGAKGQTSQLYIQNANGSFTSHQKDLFQQGKIKEAVSQVFVDVNNDGYQDLIAVYGGNEFKSGKNLSPNLYRNLKGKFILDTTAFKNFSIQASKVKAVDLNKDGFLDLSIISNTKPTAFGHPSQQHLFINDGQGNFNELTDNWSAEFKSFVNAKDIIWEDFDHNGYPDALLLGHFTSPTLFLNDGKNLTLSKEINSENGFWNALEVADFDQDGDLDFIAGNWGLNTRLTASEEEPITLYKFDFDNNGSEESILTYYYQGKETTLASKEELAKQMPSINKAFLSFKDFANATIEDVFDSNKLSQSLQRKVTELASCYFENQGNNTFIKKQLPFEAQISTINDILLDDVNDDGYVDAILIGNNYEISTQLGRLDAQHGTLLLNDQKGFFTVKKESLNIKGACRNIEKMTIKGKETYIITRNNDTPIFIQKNDE